MEKAAAVNQLNRLKMLLIGVRHWYALEPPALLHSGTALAKSTYQLEKYMIV